MDNEKKFEKVWDFVVNRLKEIEAKNDDTDYDWGMITALEEVADFMDEL